MGLAAGHRVSVRKDVELPGRPSLANMPLHRTDHFVPTVGGALAVGACGAIHFVADSVAASSKLACHGFVQDPCGGAELGKCGGPPGSRSRHLGIKRGGSSVGLDEPGPNRQVSLGLWSIPVGPVRGCRAGAWDRVWDEVASPGA